MLKENALSLLVSCFLKPSNHHYQHHLGTLQKSKFLASPLTLYWTRTWGGCFTTHTPGDSDAHSSLRGNALLNQPQNHIPLAHDWLRVDMWPCSGYWDVAGLRGFWEKSAFSCKGMHQRMGAILVLLPGESMELPWASFGGWVKWQSEQTELRGGKNWCPNDILRLWN